MFLEHNGFLKIPRRIKISHNYKLFTTAVRSVNGSGMHINNLISSNNKATQAPAPKASGTFVADDGHMDYKDANGNNEVCYYNFWSLWNRGPGGWFSLK